VDNSTDVPAGDIAYPSCVTDSSCYTGLNATQWSLTAVKCVLDRSNCSSTPTVFDLPHFCGNITYGKTCNDSCILSLQRHDLLTWMNNTCGSLPDWKGLPSNWTLLLNLIEGDLMPWALDISSDAVDKPHCPTDSANLGVFAAVNIVHHQLRFADNANSRRRWRF
jgi:hypothetical protein